VIAVTIVLVLLLCGVSDKRIMSLSFAGDGCFRRGTSGSGHSGKGNFAVGLCRACVNFGPFQFVWDAAQLLALSLYHVQLSADNDHCGSAQGLCSACTLAPYLIYLKGMLQCMPCLPAGQ